jgi:hypothetical protein
LQRRNAGFPGFCACPSVAPESLWQIGRGELVDQIAQRRQLIQPVGDRAFGEAWRQSVAPALIFIDQVAAGWPLTLDN